MECHYGVVFRSYFPRERSAPIPAYVSLAYMHQPAVWNRSIRLEVCVAFPPH